MAKKMKSPTTTTTTISNNSGTITTSNSGNMNYITTGYSYTPSKYHILGEDFESNGYLDGSTVVMISTLNILGRPFYEELKKNKVSFPDDMDVLFVRKLR